MSVAQLSSTVSKALGDLGYDTMPRGLTVPEVQAYRKGYASGARAHMRKYGGPGVVHDGAAPAPGTAARTMLARTLEENGRAYRVASHPGAHAAGMRAVAAYLRKVDKLRAMSADCDGVEFTPAAPARLELIAPKVRKSAARKRPAVAPAPVVAAVPDVAPKLRRTSKLEPCEGHARYWSSLPPADRFKNALEGGNGSSACTHGSECTLTPGTDRYAAELVTGGRVSLSSLNGMVPAEAPVSDDVWAPRVHMVPAAEVPEVPAPDVVDTMRAAGRLELVRVPAVPEVMPVHAGYVRRDGAGSLSGPACRAEGVTRLELEDMPHDLEVTCVDCLDTVARVTAAELEPAEVPDVDTVAPDVDTAPEVPAVHMSRAERKNMRRAIAAGMRAAGVKPDGDAWHAACVAAGLAPEVTR